jgi:hypothetical protein
MPHVIMLNALESGIEEILVAATYFRFIFRNSSARNEHLTITGILTETLIPYLLGVQSTG